jgi:hypothetical protein
VANNLLPFTTVKISAVRITSLGVPSTYVLDEKLYRPLVLDCDYEFRVNDKGFVLKWYHNRLLISQWIPPKKPHFFNGVKFLRDCGIVYKKCHKVFQGKNKTFSIEEMKILNKK